MTTALDMRPVRADALARELGFPSTQAFKRWLQRRSLPVWLDGGDLWTDRASIDRHIATEATKTKPKRARPRALDARDEVATAATSIMNRR